MSELGPKIGTAKGGKIVSLQEEGYYLKAEFNTKGWTLQIDDFRYPKGPLCTFRVALDTPQKILTSIAGKPIRDAYKKMYYEDANAYINETINLLQLYAKDFETDEPEPEYNPKGSESKADRLVNLALEADITLFRDQFNEHYARIPMKKWSCEASEASPLLIPPPGTLKIDVNIPPGGNYSVHSSTSSTASLTHQIWPLKSEIFKQWLSGLLWSKDKEAVKADQLNSAITVLCAMANEKPIIELHNRIASDGNNGILIDITNENWESLHVTEEGWEIIPQPVTFRRYPHQLPLCYPSKTPDLSKLLKYINIGCLGDDERHVNEQLLYLVGLITAFIPDIPHVGTVVHGGAGKAKTVTQTLSRRVIDPSSVIYNALPYKNLTSLIQVLDQHYYPVFDNLGDLDDDVSDVFCRAITGAAFQLRKLFTDNEAFLRAFKRVVNMNGINIPGERPDLLDRMIVFEALYVPMSKRRSETEILKDFEQDKPDILAAILDILVKAIKIYPTIKLERLPRMADFALWGCAVSEALGVEHSKFITAYYQNLLNVKGDVVKSRITGNLLLELLDSKLGEKTKRVTLLVSSLHYQIMGIAKQFNMDTRELPPDPTRLSRELNVIAENLPSLGYVMTKKSTNKGVELTFSMLKNTTLDSTLEDKAESYHNVWGVSDLSEILKPSLKGEGPVKSNQDQLNIIFGYIFDQGSPVDERIISNELKIGLSDLKVFLATLEKDDMIYSLRPGVWDVV